MITAGEVRRLLPHRYPMLLVDRVLDVVPGERITSVKAVTLNEPWYARLAPDASDEQFAYPESLLIESWGQSAGLLGLLSSAAANDLAGQVMLFGSAAGIEFRRRVFPGDLLEHRVRLARTFDDNLIFEGDSRVAGHPVITVARMVMAFRSAEQLTGPPASSQGAPAHRAEQLVVAAPKGAS